jgi:hypothetical protein
MRRIRSEALVSQLARIPHSLANRYFAALSGAVYILGMLCQGYNPHYILIQVLPNRGRFHETHASGVGCGARGSGLVSRLPGGLGAPPYGHYDPCAGSQLDGRSEPKGSIRFASAARGQRDSPQAPRENAAVKRRKACRPASWAGGPARDRPVRKAGPGCGVSAPAPVGASPPSGLPQGGQDGGAGSRLPRRSEARLFYKMISLLT